MFSSCHGSNEPRGQTTPEADPLGRDLVYTFDNLGRATQVTDELNQTTTSTFDAVGNMLTVKDHQGNVTANTFDRLDQLVKSRHARNGVTTLAYDAVGNTTLLIDAALNTTTWEYDRLDRAVTETNQAGGRRRMEYDAVSNMVKIVDRNGRVRELGYDGLDCNTQELWKTSGGGLVRTITYAFDAASQMTSASDPDSAYAYAYDALGRVTSVDNNGTPGVPRVILTRSYDTASRRTALSASVAGTADFLNSYSFDTLGRMTRVDQTGQAGGNTVAQKRVDFEYNAIGDFSKITRYKDLAGGSTHEVATSTFGRDALGRLTSLDHKKGATNIANYTWQFDTLNRVTQFVSPDGTTNYSYDATSQVILADHTYQTDESLVQDLNGNRALAGHTTADDNRLTSDGTYNYEYDAEGNRTRRIKISDSTSTEYEWDHRNRLTLVTDKNASGVATMTVAFAYDVFDRRIVKIYDADGAGAGGTVTAYWVYDGEDIVLAFNGSGAITNRYLQGPAVDQVMADEQVTGGTGGILWILPDNQGTARDLVDNTGTVQNHIKYDTYGKVTAESNAAINHLYGFTNRERDEETGLNYHRARWFDPITGRWLSQDPIGFEAGDTNLYRYVFNAPTLYVDPSGLDASADWAIANGLAPTPPSGQETWDSYESTMAAAFQVTGNSNGPAGFWTNVSNFFSNQWTTTWAMMTHPGATIVGGATGVVHGIAMVGNAMSLHGIPWLNNYVNQTITQNGGVYSIANVFANIGVYSLYAAGSFSLLAASGVTTVGVVPVSYIPQQAVIDYWMWFGLGGAATGNAANKPVPGVHAPAPVLHPPPYAPGPFMGWRFGRPSRSVPLFYTGLVASATTKLRASSRQQGKLDS